MPILTLLLATPQRRIPTLTPTRSARRMRIPKRPNPSLGIPSREGNLGNPPHQSTELGQTNTPSRPVWALRPDISFSGGRTERVATRLADRARSRSRYTAV
jgi:hypothetical protein